MKFIGNILSTAFGIILALIIGLVAIAFLVSSASAQVDDSEMWGFGNLNTGEVIVAMTFDFGDPSTAEMVFDDNIEIFVDEVLEPGYKEQDMKKLVKNDKDDVIPEDVTCKVFEGDSEAADDVTLMTCINDSQFIVVMGDADTEFLWGVVDDIYTDGTPEVPDGFTDLTDQLN